MLKPACESPRTPHRLPALLRRAGQALQLSRELVMGTAVSLSSSPEPPESRDPATVARFILNQKPLRMTQMLRLARLLNDASAGERLRLFQEGVVGRLVEMLGEYSRASGSAARPSPEPNARSKRSTSKVGVDTSSSPGARGRGVEVEGVGYGHGTTKSRWDLEKAVEERLMREEHLVWLLNALTSFLYCASPDFSDPEAIFLKISTIEDHELDGMRAEMGEIIGKSALLPLLEYHLRNESVFDVSQHMELYQSLFEVACSMSLYAELARPLLSGRTGRSVIRDLVPRFRDSLDVYLCSPKGQITSPDFRLVDFIYKVQRWCELLTASMERLGSVGAGPGSEDGEAAAESQTPSPSSDLSNPSPSLPLNPYAAALQPFKVNTWKFIGDYGKLVVPFQFKKEAKSLNPFSPSLKERTKRIVKELASLHNSLPLSTSNSIFVCVDEGRCDIMKVLITGPDDTPYESGVFEFDIFFPSSYPFSPPKVSFLTTGGATVRFNPNLYNDGKVCLSILGTWEGRPEEKWSPHCSLLQVLISIQGLIFVAKPYFNEPGFERYEGSSRGREFSRKYNLQIEHATMQYAIREQLRNPPEHFKDVIQRHFWHKRGQIVEQARRLSEALNRDMISSSQSPANVEELEFGVPQLKSMEKNVLLARDEILALTPPDPPPPSA